MEIELDNDLTQLLPTLNGQVTEECALFVPDPTNECERFFYDKSVYEKNR